MLKILFLDMLILSKSKKKHSCAHYSKAPGKSNLIITAFMMMCYVIHILDLFFITKKVEFLFKELLMGCQPIAGFSISSF